MNGPLEIFEHINKKLNLKYHYGIRDVHEMKEVMEAAQNLYDRAGDKALKLVKERKAVVEVAKNDEDLINVRDKTEEEIAADQAAKTAEDLALNEKITKEKQEMRAALEGDSEDEEKAS